MKNIVAISFTVLAVIIASCSAKNQESTATDQNTVKTTIDSIPNENIDTIVVTEIQQKELKSGDTVIVKGILENVMIAELGPSYIHVDVNGNVMIFEDWTDVDGYGGVSEAMIGKKVVVKYLYFEIFEEEDLHVNGKSVRGEYGSIVSEEDKNQPGIVKVEGVLTFLEEDGVSGDSPSLYTIIKANGTDLKVTGWVYEELFKYNEKQATVYGYPSASINAIEVKIELNRETTETKLDFIKEKFSTITSHMKSGDYTNIEFEVDGNGVVAQYRRAMEGEELRFISVAYCSDHGCDKTSYYFWGDQLIFSFVENSHWVGNTDNIYEKRSYYYDLEEIKCLEREISGEGGFDAVKKQLAGKAQTTLPHGKFFDRESIQNFVDLTEEVALKAPYIFFPEKE